MITRITKYVSRWSPSNKLASLWSLWSPSMCHYDHQICVTMITMISMITKITMITMVSIITKYISRWSLWPLWSLWSASMITEKPQLDLSWPDLAALPAWRHMSGDYHDDNAYVEDTLHWCLMYVKIRQDSTQSLKSTQSLYQAGYLRHRSHFCFVGWKKIYFFATLWLLVSFVALPLSQPAKGTLVRIAYWSASNSVTPKMD